MVGYGSIGKRHEAILNDLGCQVTLVSRRESPQALSADSASLREIDALFEDGDGPKRIGRFKILRTLGRGGYGVVFLALDPQLDRQVALKVPRPEALVTDELRRRFLREAKAAACSPHISN